MEQQRSIIVFRAQGRERLMMERPQLLPSGAEVENEEWVENGTR